MTLTIRPLLPDDDPAAYRLRVQAFSSAPATEFDPETPYIPAERRLGAFDGGRMVGQLGVWEFGQWYGGRRVPMGGVAGVAIAPEARGEGVGTALLRRGLEEMRGRGEVVSTLYPATHAPYRRLGWEIAGVWPRRSVPTAALRTLPRPAEGTTLRRATREDLPGMLDVYRTWAVVRPGMLDRSDLWMRRILDPEDDDVQVYVAERDGTVVGYAGYEHAETDEVHAAFRIDGLDLCGADLDAELALWQVVASNSSVAPTTRYVGAPEDPLLMLLPEHHVREESLRAVWMTRLVDAAAAVAARGYPDGLELTTSLRVVDPEVPANDGPHMLEVSGGNGRLEPGGDGRIQIDVGALSCLWAGYLSAHELGHLGRLRGATDVELEALTAAFASTTPWMRDYF